MVPIKWHRTAPEVAVHGLRGRRAQRGWIAEDYITEQVGAARMMASMIHGVNLEHLIARDMKEYEEIAVRLTLSTTKLADVKRKHRHAIEHGSLYAHSRTRSLPGFLLYTVVCGEWPVAWCALQVAIVWWGLHAAVCCVFSFCMRASQHARLCMRCCAGTLHCATCCAARRVLADSTPRCSQPAWRGCCCSHGRRTR